jgi:hypothetical protein
MIFLNQLYQRNKLLCIFALVNIAVGIICFFLQFMDDVQLLGISRWIKPMKFYFSVGIMAGTFGWVMYYLNNKKRVKACTWAMIVLMFFENGLILMQAIRGTTSHFNIKSTFFNGMVFAAMGIIIISFMVVCIFVAIQFFLQKQFTIAPAYLWGIRIGLVFFILFSFEGGVMVSRFSHTVGGKDGVAGLPFVNWSTQHGDLRIAHFLGIHALQLLPLIGYYIAKSSKQIFIYAAVYFMAVSALLMQALKGIPLFF